MSKERIVNRKTRHSAIRKTIIFIEIIVLLVATAGTWAYAKYGKFDVSNLNLKKVAVNKGIEDKYTGYTNVALFGLDARDDSLENGNSDTIIIASINNDTGEARLASVYRDTYLSMNLDDSQISSSNFLKYNKANAAYAYGSAEQALSMLNTNLDLNIKDYIAVNWAALVTAIDEAGGLDLEMTSEEVFWMNGYQLETAESCGKEDEVFDLELKDGVQHCNGVQATAFCRIRYTDGDDYKRTERQRYVLEKIFEKVKSLKLSKLNEIANKIFPMVKTNISFAKGIKYGKNCLKYKLGQSFGFPYEKTNGSVYGAGDCVFCKNLEEEVAKLHADLFGEKNYKVSDKVKEISKQVSGGPADNASNSNTDYNSGYGTGYSDYSNYSNTYSGDYNSTYTGDYSGNYSDSYSNGYQQDNSQVNSYQDNSGVYNQGATDNNSANYSSN